jgi:hypothetical protein
LLYTCRQPGDAADVTDADADAPNAKVPIATAVSAAPIFLPVA